MATTKPPTKAQVAAALKKLREKDGLQLGDKAAIDRTLRILKGS